MLRALIVGHDSELGKIIGDHLSGIGWSVSGTTRRKNLVSKNNFYLDSLDPNSIDLAIREFLATHADWDLAIISIGALNPVGRLADVNFEEWKDSVDINFMSQMRIIQRLLAGIPRDSSKKRRVLTFAGSGTNSAPVSFSAYTLSKIALIKATEILAIEYPETIFLSLGTGWMKSPIHEQTIKAGEMAGDALHETRRRLEKNEFGDPNLLIDFIDWFLASDDSRISGRNIALQGDDWKSEEFLHQLIASDNSFKLRRVK